MSVQKNRLEWMVFSLSLLLIALVLGVLLYEQLTSENLPPRLVVEIGATVRSPAGFAVPIELRNDGDRTAEAVQIEVVLVSGSEQERATATLAFVPHGSRRRAWVTFRHDPAKGSLTTRVVGYEEP
jgi:uncharacterized protein (TIGR02588 family)